MRFANACANIAAVCLAFVAVVIIASNYAQCAEFDMTAMPFFPCN